MFFRLRLNEVGKIREQAHNQLDARHGPREDHDEDAGEELGVIPPLLDKPLE